MSVSASPHTVVTVEDHAMKLLKKLPDKKKVYQIHTTPHSASRRSDTRYTVTCWARGLGASGNSPHECSIRSTPYSEVNHFGELPDKRLLLASWSGSVRRFPRPNVHLGSVSRLTDSDESKRQPIR